jgi:signal transduction histidine kinase
VRRRLTLLVGATTVLVLIAFLVPLALLVRQVAADRALSGANDVVRTIVPLIGNDQQVRLAIGAQSVPLTVYPPAGAPLGVDAPRTTAVRLAAGSDTSFTVDGAAGREIVVPVSAADGTWVVRTVVPDAQLTRGVTQAWLVLAALGLALVLLGLIVADRLARTLVGPISDLSAVSHRLARAELTARAVPAGPPELREVAVALNHLAGRIQDLLREEREQIADLSHRLRTPLTALRLEAESLRDPADATRIADAADGVERAVTAVIQQARRRATERPAGCDAAAVVADRVAFWSVLAEDTDRELRRDLPPGPMPVTVAADDLAAALDALLGNVFAHTPDGTNLSVTLTARPGGAALTVADEGPGFPAASPRRGASGGGSTGLGLDIVRQTVEAGGGAMHIDAAPGGGGRVTLDLAAPGAADSA